MPVSTKVDALESQVIELERQLMRERGLSETEMVRIPVYTTPLSAGRGNMQPSDYVVSYKDIIHDWLKYIVQIDPARAFIATVMGDSMTHLLVDGDLVLGVHGEEIDRDGVWAVAFNEELFVKHVQRERGRLVLRSENNRYSDIVVTPDDSFYPIGRIIRAVKDIY